MEKSEHTSKTSTNVIEIEQLKTPPDSGEMAVLAAESSMENQPRAKPGGMIIVAGGLIALLWSAGALAYVAGMIGPANLLKLSAAEMTGLAFGTIGPALFIFVLAWAIREISLFAKAANRIQDMADRFADPAKATRKDAAKMSAAVQTQIGSMNKAVEGALARLGAMEEVLNHHSDAFGNAEQSARERTDVLINDLRREREAVGELADQLDKKAADIANIIAEQSKMVVSAADIANLQTREGKKILASAAEGLKEAGQQAETQARNVSEQLTTSSNQIENTASALAKAKQGMEANAVSLQNAQDASAQALDSRQAQVRDLIEVSNQCAGQLKQVAEEGAQAMKLALEETLDQARHYTSIMREEGRVLADNHQSKAGELKQAADEARNALDTYAETIAKRLEHANEASFSAANWADKTFDKLRETTQALDESLQNLPDAADASAREVEELMNKRLAQLKDASQTATNEAKGIDEAFQSRIRQNYELLSDFMLKMGGTAAPAASEIEVPNPLTTRLQQPKPAEPTPVPEPETPTIDLPIHTLNDPTTQQQKPTENDGWKWKDVLSRIDKGNPKPESIQSPPPMNAGSMDRLVTALQSWNIQPDKLFFAASYRAAALARITDGPKAMTDVARTDAAEAIELVKQAFEKDPALRLDAELFVAELRQKIDAAAVADQKIHLETHLRTGDGPAYLLLEAALDA
ncbi:hypothetical protein MNBD_ALPHA06-1599 [hydrothermal vent metagenome]|uniref:Uncharacterized protein n=1 Tax=hydrothermal vent metagenome TaxID=652676 RepID=A0A3B0SWQ1_9ZZZZ